MKVETVQGIHSSFLPSLYVGIPNNNYIWENKMSSKAKISLKSIPALKMEILGFPGGAVVENLPANAGDTGSSPGLGRSHMPRSN